MFSRYLEIPICSCGPRRGEPVGGAMAGGESTRHPEVGRGTYESL